MSSKRRSISSKAWLALLFYLIIPVCALLFILHSYPELPQDRLYTRIYWILPTATVIVLLAQLSALCQKGDTKRFLLNICYTAATIVWMIGLLGGGVVLTSQWNGYDFSLHFNKYLLLIMLVILLNILYYTLEWRVYRKEKVSYPSHKRNTTRASID